MKQTKIMAELFPRTVVQLGETEVEAVDQDECQLIDESDEDWVQAWRGAVCTAKHKDGWKLTVRLTW